MPKRLDLPLGGMARKLERQRAERERADRKPMVDRIVEAFEARPRALDPANRTWGKGLKSGRAPFPRRRDSAGSGSTDSMTPSE